MKITDIKELKLFKRGKVKDIYELSNDLLLFITTDRISAYDMILDTTIPDKGKILNKLSKYWFSKTRNIIDNHLINSNEERINDIIKRYKLQDRVMLVKKVEIIPIECVVRGYLVGSLYKQNIFKDLNFADKLPQPLFTPAKKLPNHDINISFDEMKELIGTQKAYYLKDKSLELYSYGYELFLNKGIILLDTKFEFGIYQGKVILADEIFTPDSSRFFLAEDYSQKKYIFYDKEYLREYLKEKNLQGKDKISLPKDVIIELKQRYNKIYELLLKI